MSTLDREREREREERRVTAGVLDGVVHIATRHGHLKVLEVLHKFRANFEARDTQGRSALHLATAASNFMVIRKLLSLVRE